MSARGLECTVGQKIRLQGPSQGPPPPDFLEFMVFVELVAAGFMSAFGS